MRRAVIFACLLAAPAFGAVEPVDTATCAAMTSHHVLNAGAPVGCERLSVVRFRYVDFDGRTHEDGRIVVLDAVAPSVERIFVALYDRRFPIAKAQPMEAYDGNDEAAMADNNTSSFNVRPVEGTAHLSLHAYGAAIDLDPVQNPFLTEGRTHVAPAAGSAFLDRAAPVPAYAEGVADVFAANGFLTWGGEWHEPVDYQHFDIGRPLAEKLAALPPAEARALFESVVSAYRYCMAQSSDKSPAEKRQGCVLQARN